MTIQGKVVDIFRSEMKNAPLVILNTFGHEGEAVYQKCAEPGCEPFSMAAISNLNWDDDMSPWAIPPISEDDVPCGGKADEYLDLLQNEILPYVLSQLDSEPRYIAIAGYSLAGLFALYAAYRCDIFSAVASVSGSMWFPDFVDFVKRGDPSILPKTIYFSLGDRESRTSNPILNTVESNTGEIADFLSANGIHTVFEMNKGNHFKQSTLRTAKGIRWMLEHSGFAEE